MAENRKSTDTKNQRSNGARTTSPGADFATPGDREGFANNPHLDQDNRINEDRDVSGRDMSQHGIGSEWRDRVSRAGSQIRDQFRGQFQNFDRREFTSRVDRSAHESPWIHIGTIGLGALLLGYTMGRRTRSMSHAGSNLQSRSTAMGRSSQDYDDAFDE